MSRPHCCDRPCDPFELIEGAADTVDGVTISDDGHLDYEPRGSTEMFWDSQSTVGYVCRVCGTATVTADTVSIGDRRFIAT